HGLLSVAAVEAHQAVRTAVLLDVADVPEARLLERTPRAPVGRLDRGDHDGRCDDVPDEAPQDLRPEAVPDQLFLADQEVDAGDVFAELDDRVPLRVFGDEVGLDHPDRAAVDDDQVVVRRVTTLDRVALLGELLHDRIPPPARDVLAAKPLLDLAEVVEGEWAELDHASRRRRRERSVSSSRTPSRRHATRYAPSPPASASSNATSAAPNEPPS